MALLSVLRGDGGPGGRGRALVPLPGVLLAEHLLAGPEVAPHAEVQAALGAGVAVVVAVAVVADAHRLRAARGERRRRREESEKTLRGEHTNTRTGNKYISASLNTQPLPKSCWEENPFITIVCD